METGMETRETIRQTLIERALEIVKIQTEVGVEDGGRYSLISDKAHAETLRNMWQNYKRAMFDALNREFQMLDDAAQTVGARVGPYELVAAMDPVASKSYEQQRIATEKAEEQTMEPKVKPRRKKRAAKRVAKRKR
jgi:hypothetical protein